MSKTRMLVLRIAGSVVGVLVVGIAVGVALSYILSPFDPEEGSSGEGLVPAFFGALGGAVVGTVGAAAGATITQKLLRQRSSFWIAMLGGVVGLVVGALCGALLFYVGARGIGALSVLALLAAPIAVLATIVAGTVIGSGWKVQPRDGASPSG